LVAGGHHGVTVRRCHRGLIEVVALTESVFFVVAVVVVVVVVTVVVVAVAVNRRWLELC